MNPFSSGARVFIFTPMLSKPRPRVLGAAVAEAVAAARRLKPPYCTVIGKETCQYGQVLEQLTNFYQTINVFIYSL